MPKWTLDEAIALSFGKEPSQVNWAKVEGLKLNVHSLHSNTVGVANS